MKRAYIFFGLFALISTSSVTANNGVAYQTQGGAAFQRYINPIVARVQCVIDTLDQITYEYNTQYIWTEIQKK